MTEPDGQQLDWVLLLAQLPASPSSRRVAVWRRARSAGAVGVQNGAWMLPGGPVHEQFFGRLADYVHEHGGTAVVLRAGVGATTEDADIVARFRADRAKEYGEFAERGEELLGELRRESGRQNYSFAEMEENEQALDRLAAWLDKISARDFFPDDQAKDASALLERCRRALYTFTEEVYRAEGVVPPTSDSL
ncbi:Chromate resistance protein ChrB [Pseudonocardia endophytica]|uniref:ChrB N-terminal domain-containing protein n=1 Tax=Pseudonocardia endophytica TaxID=401976 RepID=A0A4R1I6D3_PSEEN|nr:Chromate resistance protein ChrB [Pseudonocardia endophytica]TCK25652.1 hypothetical protein EV378_1469 [Pseudonocardia endophytica]